ncbi:PREDICTED: steroidogenic acute regulatory protein, mitochondrial-like [Nanorana parkeri]|uniref:steroidogenic acute regulatory protein, mitochondrial-like n=1 Tax=Nanorana parkeri TaxID=125878 RepID=UPI00085462A5|nr:PREDICTED: steroidogenic acute regulatory protein, mitochondrial-like [Nanorana parkeri]
MLPATLKLCCGISHQPLRSLTDLQRPAIGAFGKEMSKIILNKTNNCLPHSLQKLLFMKLGNNANPDLEKTAMLSSRDKFYLNQIEETLHKAMSMLQQEGWQAEQKNGDWILSKAFPKIGKVFRVEAVIDSPPEHIYTQLFEELEHMDQWNPNISKVQILQRIGKNTLLTREVTAQIPVHMVSQRDFVSVQHCCRSGSSLYLIGTAAHSHLMPPQKGIIRAEAELTCIILRPLEGDRRKTHFTWLLSLDLKGWIPQSVTERVLSQSQADFISHLRRHLSSVEKI